MNIGDFLKTTKGKIISVGGVSVVAIGIAAAVLLQGDGFRSIAVQELAGSVTVVGTENNGQAYVGEHLYSGDDITVGDSSELTMCMDNDKYVYADSNTHFLLEASAAGEDSRIKITMDAGSELNVLETHLEANETYEVDTPNSTMSVRGTTFRVTVYTAADGMVYTLTEVSDGTVKARLKTKDGKYNGVEQDFTAGQSALIRGNEAFSEFVTSGMLDTSNLDMGDMDESELLLLAYSELPKDGMERLIELLENNNLIEADTGKEEATETTPTPSVTPTPEMTMEPEAEPTAEVTPTPSAYDIMYNEWVTGRDPETGGFILKDGTIFDPVYYAEHNPDVVAKYGNDPKALLYHWLTLGRDEKRPPSERAAQAQEEAFLKFAKMLDDAYAEEMRQKQASAGEDNSTGGGGISGSTGTIGAGGGITLNGIGAGANIRTYYNQNQGGDVISFMTGLSNNETITFPISLTDTNNNNVTFNWSDVRWQDTGPGQSFTLRDANGHTVTVNEYVDNTGTTLPSFTVNGTTYGAGPPYSTNGYDLAALSTLVSNW